MSLRALLLMGVLCAAPSWADEKAPSRPVNDDGPVLIFIIDNSASVPPLDPANRRLDALEKLYGFAPDQRTRLILFGGKREISLDVPRRYQNQGRWTDFYFAFQKVEEVVAAYPAGTKFKQVLITDGILDPDPEDWPDIRLANPSTLHQLVAEKTLEQLRALGLPLYVILIGEAPESRLVRRMVQVANGSVAGSDFVQGLSEFFDDDGILVRRFIYRLEPNAGLEKVGPLVRRIVTPPKPGVELSLFGSVLVSLALFIGIGVRSFPGAGDQEILELRINEPTHLATDRLRRVPSQVPAWSWRGLSLVESSKEAAATLVLVDASPEFSPDGLDTSSLDPLSSELIGLSVPDLSHRLQGLQSSPDKDEVIYALNLDYVARDFDSNQAARLLTTPPAERRRIDAMDFLRAKAHLLHNDTLYHRLTRPRVSSISYGPRGAKRELQAGSEVCIGPYDFQVESLTPGGRKDYRMVLVYHRVPSFLRLKEIVPGNLQRLLRLRRSHERVVK